MLLVVDKPLDLSSFDVVRRFKHEFPNQKIWHSGTLDPKATGLMIIWVWKGTKQLSTLIGLDKSYETVIDFSKMSDTRDLWYWNYFEEYMLVDNWIKKEWQIVKAPDLSQIKDKLNLLIPSSLMPLPTFSAKKKNWKKLYDLWRDGIVLDEKREMKIYWYEIIDYSFPILRLRLDVWSGTYIRSIWYWLWKELGLWWILTELRRYKVGERNLEKMKLNNVVDYSMHDQNWSFKWEIIEN